MRPRNSVSPALRQKPSPTKASGVDLESSEGGYYLANSEGTEVKEPEGVVVLRVRASAQAPDGMTVRDAVAFHAPDAGHMPGDAEMQRGVTAATCD